jgi:hypothetical protein
MFGSGLLQNNFIFYFSYLKQGYNAYRRFLDVVAQNTNNSSRPTHRWPIIYSKCT